MFLLLAASVSDLFLLLAASVSDLFLLKAASASDLLLLLAASVSDLLLLKRCRVAVLPELFILQLLWYKTSRYCNDIRDDSETPEPQNA